MNSGAIALILLPVGIALITASAFWSPIWLDLWKLGWAFTLLAGYIGGKEKIREASRPSSKAHPIDAERDTDRVILR